MILNKFKKKNSLNKPKQFDHRGKLQKKKNGFQLKPWHSR